MSELRELLDSRFGGLLRHGAHEEGDGACCAVELCRAARGLSWGDEPVTLDYRRLNDAFVQDDAVRTEHLLPTMESLFDWLSWPEERRVRWVQTVALRTIREVVPIALRAWGYEQHAAACERAETLAEARAAAAAAAAAAYAAYAAAAADDAAAAAAAAYAAAAERVRVLALACRIWREAAEESAS